MTSPQNPLVKQLRKLQQQAGRREQGKFLVEGTHLVEEAIAVGWDLTHLCYTSRWMLRHSDFLATVPSSTLQLFVSDQVIESLTTTTTPDGVMAVAVDQEAVKKTPSVVSLAIAVDRLQNPDNLGALIRASAAVGADGIWVGSDSVDRTNPKVLRASAGQWFRQPPHQADLPIWLKECRAANIQVLGADSSGKCYWDCDLQIPTVFVLGNEGSGMSTEVRSNVDALISIPMSKDVESLNVGVSGAILLYEALRQRSR